MNRITVDERRNVFVAKSEQEAYEFCCRTLTEEITKAISSRGSCAIALSGGSTPLPLFDLLSRSPAALRINWSLIDFFWCDERRVPPIDPESNFGTAMRYLHRPPLNDAKKHPLPGNAPDLDSVTLNYEKIVKRVCPEGSLDIVLLGIGEDGHTASLFPHTDALKEEKRLYVPNYVSQKNCWRLTMTFPEIERAKKVYVLALGREKAKILKQILFGEYNYEEIPAQRLGTITNPVSFIIDKKAANGLGF